MKTNTFIQNYFYSFHPISLLIFFILIFTSLISRDYSIITVLAFASLSLLYIQLEGIKAYAVKCIYFFILTFLMMIFNIFFNHSGDTPLLYVNDLPITKESLLYGLYTGLMISSLMLWFNAFNYSFDNGKISYLFSKYFPTIGLVISMSFGFYERFKYKEDKIKHILFTENFIAPKHGIINKIRFASIVFSILISVMLEDSVDTATSMVSRGYANKRKKTYKKYFFRKKDFILILISILLIKFPLILFFIPIIYNIYMEIYFKIILSKTKN